MTGTDLIAHQRVGTGRPLAALEVHSVRDPPIASPRLRRLVTAAYSYRLEVLEVRRGKPQSVLLTYSGLAIARQILLVLAMRVGVRPVPLAWTLLWWARSVRTWPKQELVRATMARTIPTSPSTFPPLGWLT